MRANILLFIVLMLIPLVAWSQAATPTPTATATPTFTPPSLTGHGQVTAQLKKLPVVSLLPTAMPTAYSTPQVLNPQRQEIKIMDGVNDLDCEVGIDFDGDAVDDDWIPAKSAWSPSLPEAKLHHNGTIGFHGTEACTSGKFRFSAKY